jgi:hypothetical protein
LYNGDLSAKLEDKIIIRKELGPFWRKDASTT